MTNLTPWPLYTSARKISPPLDSFSGPCSP